MLQTTIRADLKHPGVQSDILGRMKNHYENMISKENPKNMMKDNGMDTDMSHDFPVVCRPTPYNMCYSFDAVGNIIPPKRKRPIMVIRVYY